MVIVIVIVRADIPIRLEINVNEIESNNFQAWKSLKLGLLLTVKIKQ